jgi:hypothetical protein
MINGRLQITLALENRSEFDVDLESALQMRDNTGSFIRPESINPPGSLPRRSQAQQRSWQYSLGTASAQAEALRLIYAPRGWSGPVFVYRLSK